MVKNRFGLWLGLVVATMVGVGVAAYFVLKQDREEQGKINQVQRLIKRSQDIVQRLESELGSRALPQSDASHA